MKPVILCVDDQRDVLAAIVRDLQPFAGDFNLQAADSAADARAVIDELAPAGTRFALAICDHVMPGETGVDLLASLRRRADLPGLRRLLLTGLATHEDTIRAINEAAIDRYVAKPWQPEQLVRIVAELVTAFVMEQMPDDYRRFLDVLDKDALFDAMQRRGDR